MKLSASKVLVIGLGKTGIETVRFLVDRGASVIAVDEKRKEKMEEAVGILKDMPVELLLGVYEEDVVSRVDMVVPSPGVPPFHPLLVKARENGVPVVSEIELAYRFLETPMIAITGTNGKTTTTKLIGEILSQAGKRVFVGGNIGTPLVEYVRERQYAEWAVVEISSFQLQWTRSFHPTIAVLLNVTDDHIDYHSTFDEYRRVKEKIFANQVETDLAVLNADDEYAGPLSRSIKADVRYFGSLSDIDNGVCCDGRQLRYRDRSGSEEIYPLDRIRMRGTHNYENAMAALLVAKRCGCSKTTILDVLGQFQGLPHRVEFAGALNGIEFYNDSKGTNIGAVEKALEAFSQPVILLMGGRNKGSHFSALAGPVRGHVRKLILFGEAREEIFSELGDIVETKTVQTLRDATKLAWNSASPGDVVLLSPGCASFDEFRDYKERGDVFKDLVRQITGINNG
jgi:UDP-N-acetylmuramoylalanine--D-glutamate ligase